MLVFYTIFGRQAVAESISFDLGACVQGCPGDIGIVIFNKQSSQNINTVFERGKFHGLWVNKTAILMFSDDNGANMHINLNPNGGAHVSVWGTLGTAMPTLNAVWGTDGTAITAGHFYSGTEAVWGTAGTAVERYPFTFQYDGTNLSVDIDTTDAMVEVGAGQVTE